MEKKYGLFYVTAPSLMGEGQTVTFIKGGYETEEEAIEIVSKERFPFKMLILPYYENP